MIINQAKIIGILKDSLYKENLGEIKWKITNLKNNLKNFKVDKLGILNIASNGQTINVSRKYIESELQQILETKTLERTKHYLNRLIKSLTEIKTSKINDINLNRWKEYNDILTDSLWILNKRDNSGAHSAEYWGNFIPQIPNQLLRRYTKKGEWVLDPFLGSGTTLIECKRLGRNGIGVELQSKVVKLAKKNIEKERDIFSKEVRTEVINGDSTQIDFKIELKRIGIKSIQFLIMHPPYWDIIKFSNDEKDLSNAKTIEDFLIAFGKVVDNTCQILDKERYFAVVIGDKYSRGEWIPLGFYTMQEVLKRKYTLKSIIVKNFEETKGKMNQKELWRYRALVGGFYIFKHEYVMLFKKKERR
ncbi:MAG: DNA methyltransferase [Candidatus Cloacimonadota bacterium]|nr:DNA methyltransferase [Candidatus Cloacimonadota bacterium]